MMRRTHSLCVLIVALSSVVWLVSISHWYPGQAKFFYQAGHAHSGDEPHYLMLVNSLLQDGDFELSEDYAKKNRAGFRFRKTHLDHHTIVRDKNTGETVLWSELYDYRRNVNCAADDSECIPYARKKNRQPATTFDVGGAEYSAHPPAFAALIALALSPFRLNVEQVEPNALRTTTATGILTVGLFVLFHWRRGSATAAIVVGGMAFALASPWLAYTKALFSEPAAGLFLLLALWARVERAPRACALALFIAIAIKPPYALVALVWLLDDAMRGRIADALKFGALLGIAGAGLVWFNVETAGRVIVSGTQGWVPPQGLKPALGTLFDPRYGLMLFAPWVMPLLVIAVQQHLGKATKPEGGSGRPALGDLQRAVAFPLLAYYCLLASFGSFGQNCLGPRLWIPFLPWFGVLLVDLYADVGRTGKLVLLTSCAAGFAINLPAALQYYWAWDRPFYYALTGMLGAPPP